MFILNGGNVEVIGDLGILTFDSTNFSKTEISFIANGVVEEGNTQAVSGGEVYKTIDSFTDISDSYNLVNPKGFAIVSIWDNKVNRDQI